MDADIIPIDAFIRIQMEFLEMPGLKLTPEQIARLYFSGIAALLNLSNLKNVVF